MQKRVFLVGCMSSMLMAVAPVLGDAFRYCARPVDCTLCFPVSGPLSPPGPSRVGNWRWEKRPGDLYCFVREEAAAVVVYIRMA